MEMALAPDGKIFLIELAGLVKTIEPKSGKVGSGWKVGGDYRTGEWTYRPGS